MLEKYILIGSVYSGVSKGTNEPFYSCDYLDIDTGKACRDYISSTAYNLIKDCGLAYGTKVIGIFNLDRYRKIVLDGIKTK